MTNTTFGMLVDNMSANADDDFQPSLRQWTPYLAGTMNNSMKVSFEHVFQQAGNSANLLGGSLLNAQDGTTEGERNGGLKQAQEAMTMFSRLGTMIGELNNAQEDMPDGMRMMDELARSVLSVGYAVGGIGHLVDRIVSSQNGVPSPLHMYVELSTEDDEEIEE